MRTTAQASPMGSPSAATDGSAEKVSMRGPSGFAWTVRAASLGSGQPSAVSMTVTSRSGRKTSVPASGPTSINICPVLKRMTTRVAFAVRQTRRTGSPAATSVGVASKRRISTSLRSWTRASARAWTVPPGPLASRSKVVGWSSVTSRDPSGSTAWGAAAPLRTTRSAPATRHSMVARCPGRSSKGETWKRSMTGGPGG